MSWPWSIRARRGSVRKVACWLLGSGLVGCLAPERQPWPEAELLQGAQSALQYGLSRGSVVSARVLNLASPIPAWTHPEGIDAEELWLYPCALDALGLPPGPFADRNEQAPRPGRRLSWAGGDDWAVSAEEAPRPWPAAAPVPTPCWNFDAPSSIELGPIDTPESGPTFLVPFGPERWLVGGRGMGLHLLRRPGGEPGPLVATPVSGPHQLVTGYGDGGDTAYALTSTGTLVAITARGREDLEVTSLASLTATQTACYEVGALEPILPAPWAMDGARVEGGATELVVTSQCGMIARYRSATNRWTLLRANAPAERLGALEEGSAVLYLGPDEWLITDRSYGVLARLRGQQIQPEHFGDDTARSISLGRGPAGEVVVGTSNGQLRRREVGAYVLLGEISGAGVLSFAALGSGWAVAGDVPNGGHQIPPALAGLGCNAVDERPQFSGVEQAYRLVFVGSTLVALVWETDDDQGRLKLFQPRRPPSASCLGPL